MHKSPKKKNNNYLNKNYHYLQQNLKLSQHNKMKTIL